MLGVPAGSHRNLIPLRALALATHPGPTVAVTLVATLLAFAAGMPAGRAALVMAAVLAGQASIGWSNDWLDADRDRAVARADKPVVQGAVAPALLRRVALGSATVAIVLSLLLGVVPGLLLLAMVASGWVYNLGVKRTAASALPYVTGFGALPAGVVAAVPGALGVPWWLVTAGAALGVAGHLANVVPDLEGDLATGVRGLPHRLGARACVAAGAVLLGAAALVLVLGPGEPSSALRWAGLALALPAIVVAALGCTSRFHRLALPSLLPLAVLDVLLLLAGGAIATP